jgi:hypothetical protein
LCKQISVETHTGSEASFLYEHAGVYRIDCDASTVNGLKIAVKNMVFTTSNAKLESWREGFGDIEVIVHRVTPSHDFFNKSEHYVQYVVQNCGKTEPTNRKVGGSEHTPSWR